MARIALPVKRGKLSEEFELCDYYLVYDLESHKELTKVKPELLKKDLFGKFQWLINYKVSDIVAHHMENATLMALSDTKINLFVGLKVESPEQLIGEFERGVLKSNLNSMRAS